MAWLAVDEDGDEAIFDSKPHRECNYWIDEVGAGIILPSGSIYKLIGKKLVWGNEPVEI